MNILCKSQRCRSQEEFSVLRSDASPRLSGLGFLRMVCWVRNKPVTTWRYCKVFYWVWGQSKVCVWGNEAAQQEAEKSNFPFSLGWFLKPLCILLCNLILKCCSGHKVCNSLFLVLRVGIQPHRCAAQTGSVLFLEELWAVLDAGNGEWGTIPGKPIWIMEQNHGVIEVGRGL